MAVRIRLRRMGRKKQPQYRVVVTDKANARDGRFVESLGHYKPLTNPARLVLDLERVDYWIDHGAEPSDTVRSLIRKARTGGNDRLAVGDVDVEAEKAQRTEELAAKRKAEAELAATDAAPEPAPQDVKAEAAESAEEAAEAVAQEAETTAEKAEADASAGAVADAAAEADAEAAEADEDEEKKD